jgi:hypothetical protein
MSLLNEASFLVTPNGYKEDKLYAAIPTNGNGDMTFTRATTATRVDENDLISSVASNVPRIDYTGGGCPSILLEPARINYAKYSQQFDVSETWTQANSPTITPNTHTAPDGTFTACTFTAGAASAQIQQLHEAGTSGVSYTGSVYIKRLFGSGEVRIRVSENTNTAITVTSDWTRVSFTATSTTSNQIRIGFNISTIGDSVAIWGAQLEKGAYPTSYIPTTIETVSRVADVINRDDIYENNLITDAGGTWFVHLINNVPYTRDAFNVGISIRSVSSATSGDNLEIRNTASTPERLSIGKRISGAYSGLFDTTTDTVKLAIKWNGATADVFVNGAKVVTETVFTTVNMEFLGSNGNDVSKYIKQMALFPTPLHEDECKALTTL